MISSINTADPWQSEGNPERVSGFSSRGPTIEKRVKPDVIAPGSMTQSTRSREQELLLDCHGSIRSGCCRHNHLLVPHESVWTPNPLSSRPRHPVHHSTAYRLPRDPVTDDGHLLGSRVHDGHLHVRLRHDGRPSVLRSCSRNARQPPAHPDRGPRQEPVQYDQHCDEHHHPLYAQSRRLELESQVRFFPRGPVCVMFYLDLFPTARVQAYYAKLHALFAQKVSARKFSKTHVELFGSRKLLFSDDKGSSKVVAKKDAGHMEYVE